MVTLDERTVLIYSRTLASDVAEYDREKARRAPKPKQKRAWCGDIR